MTTTSASEFDYQAATRRLERAIWILAILGAAALAIAGHLPASIGFLAGAAVAGLNFRWLKKGVNALADSAGSRGRRSAVLLGLRYVLLGTVLYVMMKFFGISLMAVLAGLLVPVAAVLCEVIYELFYART